MSEAQQNCLGCGKRLPEAVLCAVSHTIKPGALLCSGCGSKESLDAAWAEGRRIGLRRAEAAMSVLNRQKGK